MSLLERFWREPVLRTVLPNGLTVIIKRDASAALASVQVWVKTGSIHEGDQLGAGLSHYLEHMLFKGTERRAGREISATVQAHGGYINAYTTFDRTVYYIDLPSEHTAMAVDLLADAVLSSTLPEGEVAKEKEVIMREIAMTRDDPDDRLWQAMFATAFREHPYRFPVIGHRELFAGNERGELEGYYRSRYVPNNLVVVIVGGIDPDETLKVVEEKFGGRSRGRLRPVLVTEEPLQLGPRELHVTEDVEIVRAAIAWQVPGLTHADAPVLDLLAMVLGHGDSSILWQELREKAKVVHTIDASCWNPGTSGLFCVSFTSESGNREKAEAVLDKVLKRCAVKGFKAQDIKQAVRQLIANEVASRQTMSGQASRLGAAEVVAGDLHFSQQYFERLERVTAAQLKQALKKYLVRQTRTAVSSNPMEAKAAIATAPKATGKASRKKAESVGEFELVTLKNGARLLLQQEKRLPQVHLRMVWQGGPGFEDPAKRGTSGLVSTLLSKDTKRRSAAEVARYIESVGGSFYPFSGNNSLGLAVEVLPPDWLRAVSVLSDAALAPAFRADTFAVEKEAQLAGLRQDLDDVVTEGRKLLRRKFFGDHPMGIDANGTVEGVEKLAAGDIAAQYGRLNFGSNVVIAVAGDFEPKAVKPKLTALLEKVTVGAVAGGGDPGKSAIKRGKARGDHALHLRRLGQPGDFVEIRDKEQAVVLRGYPGPALHTPDYYVSEVADELFSGMASQLFERVREEKSLAYFVRSSRVTSLDTAMFSFLAGTKPGREDEVLAEIDIEIERVQTGKVEEAELRRCQARLKAGRRQSLQTNAARALHASLNALQGLPIDDWKNYDARIEAVTIADLAAFAMKYLVRAQATQLVVRPKPA
ncbi:MAG TPA: pitrilysin family protein [Opitutaceae bacterium]